VTGKTVDAIRCQLEAKVGAVVYLVYTDRHVFLLGYDGDTLIDTDPCDGLDNREVLRLYAIRRKDSFKNYLA
jgi:hypothetical protein